MKNESRKERRMKGKEDGGRGREEKEEKEIGGERRKNGEEEEEEGRERGRGEKRKRRRRRRGQRWRRSRRKWKKTKGGGEKECMRSCGRTCFHHAINPAAKAYAREQGRVSPHTLL